VDHLAAQKDSETTSEEYLRVLRRRTLILSALPFALLISAFLAVFIGTAGPLGPGVIDQEGHHERISFGDAIDAILNAHGDWPYDYHAVFWDVRIPRVLLAGLVGAALACSGTAMQAVFRNPMADPFIVGVSSGASLGAVVVEVTGLGALVAIGTIMSPVFAFITALVTVLVVYSLGTVRGRVYVDTLLLSGVAVAAFLSALVSFLIYFAHLEYHRIIFWLLGSLAQATWPAVATVALAVGVGSMLIFLFSRDLNALLLGEETAHNLGADPEFLKTLMLVVAAVMTSAAVAFTGVIGFIGLIIPHMMRIAVGADHRILLPSATLAGATFLILADSVARTVISPNALPVGIITALSGGPFFLYLLRRSRTESER